VLRPDYAIHDGVYARKRSDGRSVGWLDAENTAFYLGRLEGWIGDRAPRRILELGCGAGDQSLWLAAHGFEVVGIDISPNAIEWAREKAAARGLPATFEVGNVLELPFADGAFDYVLDGACWHCIVGEDRKRFVAEAARVLRLGGTFIGITMVNGSKFPGPQDYDPALRVQFVEGTAVRYWTTTAEALEDLDRAGLEMTRYVERPADGEHVEDMLFVDAVKVG
jgi:ubiquinone/menaquinone biosynthesis C-methylase UbiE